MTDSRIQKWTGWIDGTIKNELVTMHLHRYVWQEVTKLVEDNTELPDSYWWEFMLDTYTTTQATAVRRQADRRRDVVSLKRLLIEVQGRASAITRAYWIETLWKAEDHGERVVAGRQWDEHYGGSVGGHLDPAIPRGDLARLDTAAEEVKNYVDMNVAHTSADPVAREVTLNVGDVHRAMDDVARVFRRYYGLFTASTLLTLTPFLQHDFFGVFRQAWMREGYQPEAQVV